MLRQAGIDLRALGRLHEAVQPTQAALEAYIENEEWRHAAIVASNLGQLFLTIGYLPQALELAQQGVELADRSGDGFQRLGRRASLAHTLHQVGHAEEATAIFRVAEEMQQQQQPEHPLLYSLPGFRYCVLLLDQGQAQEVKERASRTVKIAEQRLGLLPNALDNLSLARAFLLEAEQKGTGDLEWAAECFQRAIDGLRRAGRMDHLPRGLLARAALYQAKRDYIRSEHDIAEALLIATRGGMSLHLADCHLELARLHLAQDNRPKVHEHWATAKAMIERMGYHRRDNEVIEIARQLR